MAVERLQQGPHLRKDVEEDCCVHFTRRLQAWHCGDSVNCSQVSLPMGHSYWEICKNIQVSNSWVFFQIVFSLSNTERKIIIYTNIRIVSHIIFCKLTLPLFILVIFLNFLTYLALLFGLQPHLPMCSCDYQFKLSYLMNFEKSLVFWLLQFVYEIFQFIPIETILKLFPMRQIIIFTQMFPKT